MADLKKDRAGACDASPKSTPKPTSDSPATGATAQADDAAFRTAQRLAKLEGFGLIRDGAELVLTRWNLTRCFRSTASVLAFLGRMGRRP